jgi:hypothetical protein
MAKLDGCLLMTVSWFIQPLSLPSRPQMVEPKLGSQHGWKACKKMYNSPSVSSRDVGTFSSVGYKITAQMVQTKCFLTCCCALNKKLLDIDGLDKQWEQGVQSI